MYTNVNLAAPIGAMAFLGTGLLFFVAGLSFLYTVIKGELAGTKIVLSAVTVVAAIYIGFLLLFSFTSSETLLARGQEKHFCEIDCHLAYSILDVRQTKALGNGPNQSTADGLYHIVTIKTRFDENTISSTRGNGTLTPNSRLAIVVDAQGRKYLSSESGSKALAQTEDPGTPFTEALRPSETYTTRLVFDLPANVANPTLLLNEGAWLTRFIIGHENSPLHKKTRFQL
ncbi:MAG: hypothetical protein H0W28_10625 [Pyrinomonadaceae bacterium]|jgi:hypothetical protein|nr:hypothetical protein [Pyrinomonadaceae bacterium]